MIHWLVLFLEVQLLHAWVPRASMPDDCWIFDLDMPRAVRSTGDYGHVYEIALSPCRKTTELRPGECRDSMLCRLGSIHRSPSSLLVCWHRFKVWWIRPVFSQRIPPETLMILFQNEGEQRYRLVIASDVSSCCSLMHEDNDTVIVSSGVSNQHARLYCGMGIDPYALIRDGMKQVTQMSLDQKKKCCPLSLGWCTWNACYTQISGSQLVEQVKALLTSAPVQWMILDDGWQHTTNDAALNGEQWKERLESLRESPSKFSDMSLREAISQIKLLGIQDVWVWHTLMGYWLGVNHDCTILYPHFSSGSLDSDPSASREASVERGIGIPRDATVFFDKYHDYLKRCGVSGVKVDAQGVVGALRPYKWSDDSVERGGSSDGNVVSNLHQALSASVKSHFGSAPNILHCMSHAPEVIFIISHLYETLPLLRASDDHYPDNRYSHGPHVVACAFNSLMISHVAVPDWDMFTTNLPDERMVRLHAISRCICGGPVYISDPPSLVKRNVVDWICCKDGTVLPCRETALPVAKCLLNDPLAHDGDPFVLFNTNGSEQCVTSGVLAVFHLASSGTWDYDRLNYGPVDSSIGPPPNRRAKVRPADIPHFEQQTGTLAFLAVPFFSPEKSVVLPAADSEFTLDLHPLECDVITILPIQQLLGYELVVLGIKGRINGAGSVLDVNVFDNNVQVNARGCGQFQFGIRPRATDALQVHVKDTLLDTDVGHVVIAGFDIYTIDLNADDKEHSITISIAT